ncbi:hypothetical protein CY652_21490 [Burkholderia sp. WAC0059]|uniref:RBBP9/YdeN family alpha/beta hydrolase n=1 Tax=Burkholderia sp. WAC0059 TaxID=2066022 RepID=UPI000C7F035F|nr:alpha/beta hydrolase [Burkholderia sp. WAC0059]PLZ00341.1 hypothetical protein CY652_21490 [Burkholderia sp. WAC0059]
MIEHKVLVVPGYLNSGEGHWQTRWEAAHPGFARVRMPDWAHPDCDAWCEALDAAVAAAGAPVLLAAHSLGCLTIACWAARRAASRATPGPASAPEAAAAANAVAGREEASRQFAGAGGAARPAVARVVGALLVAVPDPDGPQFPRTASGFEPIPLEPLPFPGLVVASSDDPYGSVPFSQRCAEAWGSRWVGLGARGHINAQSGLGDWPEGLEWLASLAR